VEGCLVHVGSQGKTILNIIEEAQECPDSRTKVRIDHGTGDLQVPCTSSEELCALFLKKEGWPNPYLLLHDGQKHAASYKEAITESELKYLND
jgi:hypothetical protein